MTKADQVVDTAADKVAAFVRDARDAGGVRGKLGDALADDPEFIRKLKPSLIKARAKGRRTVEPTPHAPSGPQVERPKPPKSKRGGGAGPWLVVGVAFAAGYLLAKTIDWRGHAHPRL
jgi:hypothetical protein